MALLASLYGMDYNQCPWVEIDIATQAYLRMGKVTSVTFTYTFINAIYFLLCRGYATTVHAVNRDQATNLTMVMGIIYLLYSAYFLSSDFQSMAKVVNLMIAFVYFILGFINIGSLSKEIKNIKRYLTNQPDELP